MQSIPGVDVFIHVRIIMGTIVGLGVTRILMGLASMIQHPGRAKLSGIQLLWSLSILLELVFFWWWEIELYSLPHWSFGVFAFLVGYSINLFLLAALLFPDDVAEYEGYEDFFLKRRHWFFAAFGTTFVFDVVDTLVKGQPYFDTLGISYLIQVPVGLALCIIAASTTSRRFHYAAVIAYLCYQAWWIWVLFDIAG